MIDMRFKLPPCQNAIGKRSMPNKNPHVYGVREALLEFWCTATRRSCAGTAIAISAFRCRFYGAVFSTTCMDLIYLEDCSRSGHVWIWGLHNP